MGINNKKLELKWLEPKMNKGGKMNTGGKMNIIHFLSPG